MTLSTLLVDLGSKGVRLSATPTGQLRVDAPKGVMTAELTAELTKHKSELLGLLGPASSSPKASSNSVVTGPELALVVTPDLVQVSQSVVNRSAGNITLDHRVIDNEDQLAGLLEEIIQDSANTVIAVDAAWHGDHPGNDGAYLRTIQFSWQPGCAACVMLRGPGGTPVFGPAIEAALPHLRRLLKSSPERAVRIVGHFFQADLPWLIDFGLDLREEFETPAEDGLFAGPAWDQTRIAGGFDTGLAAHARNEAEDPSLKSLALKHTGVPDYEADLRRWKASYCEQRNIKAGDLDDYGDCPTGILASYGNHNVDVTRRLFDVYNGPGGFLDSDEIGKSSRRGFWLAMRATSAVLEMQIQSLAIDRRQLEGATASFTAKRQEVMYEIRRWACWPRFNPATLRWARKRGS